jgi:hypothetical protein
MEDNKHFLEAEVKQAAHRESSLQLQLKAKDEKIKKQELLLEEMYKLIYYKRAWLTLSDDNILGMRKVIKTIPEEERCVVTPRLSTDPLQLNLDLDDNDPWGV